MKSHTDRSKFSLALFALLVFALSLAWPCAAAEPAPPAGKLPPLLIGKPQAPPPGELKLPPAPNATPVADNEQVAAGLKSAVPQQKLAALAALLENRALAVPDTIRDTVTDHDVRVRAAALRVMAVRRHPQALEALTQSVGDSDLGVRCAAIAGLGQFGGEEAREKLIMLAGNHAELIRVAAVDALADMQADEDVRATITDKSWRVRRSVAKALVHEASRVNADAARQLLTDKSGEVQRQVLESLKAWPLEQAGPLLLHAIGEGSYQTRKDGAAQFAERWPVAAGFPVDSPPERRSEALTDLQNRWAAQFGLVDRATLAGASLPERGTPGVAPESLEQALERLASPDQNQRRRGADDIGALAKQGPLPQAALGRVYDLIVREKDPTIWQEVLIATTDDPSPEAIALAYAAITHPAADVRRRACDYLGKHGRAEHATMLLPALEDSQTSVALAAATALGHCGPLDNVRPLEQALVANDKRVRIAAATSLAQLGAPAGVPALERLCYDADEAVRREVVASMGELKEPQFVPTLVRLLDDRLGVRKAAMKSLTQITGQDVAAGTSDLNEQVARWKKWHAAKDERGRLKDE